MIHTTEDFYNKVATDIKERFFANENHGYTNNAKYHAANYAMECFSNGCLTYKVFIGRLAKNCGSNNATIHNIVEKYIVSFGEYQYKPGKLYSEAKTCKS